MHAVLVNVTIHEPEAAAELLRGEVVPRVSQAPGFVAGYWTRSQDNRGISMLVFESEEAAEAARAMIDQQPPTDAVTIDGHEVREVVAHA
jgi:hypothetical protein